MDKHYLGLKAVLLQILNKVDAIEEKLDAVASVLADDMEEFASILEEEEAEDLDSEEERSEDEEPTQEDLDFIDDSGVESEGTDGTYEPSTSEETETETESESEEMELDDQ